MVGFFFFFVFSFFSFFFSFLTHLYRSKLLNPDERFRILGGAPGRRVNTDQDHVYQSSISETGIGGRGLFSGARNQVPRMAGPPFDAPVQVRAQSSFFHFIDKPLVAADPPINPNKSVSHLQRTSTSHANSVLRLRNRIELVVPSMEALLERSSGH